VVRAKVNSTKTNRAKAEIVVKQEINDDDVVAKAAGKSKEAKPAKDCAIGGGNLKVIAKTYHHSERNVVAKTMKAETILASIAEGLSPEAQEKHEMTRMNLFRKTMHQERNDRYPASFLARYQSPSILPFRASFAQLRLISQDLSPSHLPRLCSSKVLALDKPGPTSEKPSSKRIRARLSDIFR